MKLPFLHQEVEVSTDLRESNDLLDNPDALQERIAADGYLLIRDYTIRTRFSRHVDRFWRNSQQKRCSHRIHR